VARVLEKSGETGSEKAQHCLAFRLFHFHALSTAAPVPLVEASCLELGMPQEVKRELSTHSRQKRESRSKDLNTGLKRVDPMEIATRESEE